MAGRELKRGNDSVVAMMSRQEHAAMIGVLQAAGSPLGRGATKDGELVPVCAFYLGDRGDIDRSKCNALYRHPAWPDGAILTTPEHMYFVVDKGLRRDVQDFTTVAGKPAVTVKADLVAEIPQGDPMPGAAPPPTTGPTVHFSSGVTVYIDSFYRGRSTKIVTDTPPLGGGFDNEISSIEISDGLSVAAFSEPSYRGSCTTLTSNVPQTGKVTGANDSISSFWIGRACPGPAATLFRDTNYRGRGVTIIGDVANLKDLGFNDETSSIRLTGGTPIAVYKDSNFRGACTTFRGDGANMRGTAVGNDNVSSIRVRWTCEGGAVQ